MKRSAWMTGFSAVLVTVAGALAMQASLAGDKPSKAELEVEYRQGLYTVIAGNFGPLGAIAADKAPFDAAEVKLRAGRVAYLAPILKEAFPADSSGVGHTAAKPEIWTDKAGFDKALQAFIDSSAALAAAANGSDVGKIKAAIGETGKTCKACHDKFKAKD